LLLRLLMSLDLFNLLPSEQVIVRYGGKQFVRIADDSFDLIKENKCVESYCWGGEKLSKKISVRFLLLKLIVAAK